MKHFKNPIIPGFYPDPSICRVGEDYYLATSTFSYFPGVPVFHSKDLVNWELIGHALDRTEQLQLKGISHSAGIYAPTLRYHSGIFYMITTNVAGIGNFYVTATDPHGPWSDPVCLDAEGIDPSLFFDDDGKVYYTGTREKPKEISHYYGDNEIWMQELDLKSGKLIGEKYVLWEGALVDAVWPEGPHLYKKDGYYYLMISEGGTGHEHALTIARSRNLKGPYQGNPCNPIFTHRHLGVNYPIVNVGHGDLVQIQDGSWWMVFLASRPYGGYYRNLGRETFLVSVDWENDWPVVNRGFGIAKEYDAAPNLPEFYVPIPDACDHFEDKELDKKWIFLRTPEGDFWSLTQRDGYLRLKLKPESIAERVNPSFIARRQCHQNFTVSTALEFTPDNSRECAGIVLIQNNDFHFRFIYTKTEKNFCIRLIKREGGKEEIIAEKLFESKKIIVKVVAKGQSMTFYYGTSSQKLMELVGGVDATILSSDKAGGFVGTCIGMYASSQGEKTANYADFDWFEYTGC